MLRNNEENRKEVLQFPEQFNFFLGGRKMSLALRFFAPCRRFSPLRQYLNNYLAYEVKLGLQSILSINSSSMLVLDCS